MPSALKKPFQETLKRQISKANNELVAKRRPLDQGLTTLTALYLSKGGIAFFANVGDSPSFLIRSGKLVQTCTIDNNG